MEKQTAANTKQKYGKGADFFPPPAVFFKVKDCQAEMDPILFGAYCYNIRTLR
jgi:hypothetical protein